MLFAMSSLKLDFTYHESRAAILACTLEIACMRALSSFIQLHALRFVRQISFNFIMFRNLNRIGVQGNMFILSCMVESLF